jgi:uncharacterized membrane protein (DUF373 family)
MAKSELARTVSTREERLRELVALAFSRFEDVVYVGLGLMLAYSAAALLVTGAMALWRSVSAGAPISAIIDLLDRALLVLMIIELLYTVQVSFRAHALVPEPFLVVGLIAVTRRILVVTAEFGHLVDKPDAAFRKAVIEVAVLTAMLLAMVTSLRLLRIRPLAPRVLGSAVEGGR